MSAGGGTSLFSMARRKPPVSSTLNSSVNYSLCSRHQTDATTVAAAAAAEDDLDDIAVVSSAAHPCNVRYGQTILGAAGSGTGSATNGPRVVPGIIKSRGIAGPQRQLPSSGNLRSSATYGSPDCQPTDQPSSLRPASSKQSLLDFVGGHFGARSTTLGNKATAGGGGAGTSYMSRVADASSSSATVRRVSERLPSLADGTGAERSLQRYSQHQHHHHHHHHQQQQHQQNGQRSDSSLLQSHYRRCRWTFVFDPAGRLCYYWSMVVSLAFLYNFWTLIYRCAFQEIRTSSAMVWFLLDYTADLIYALDIVFHFRTGYLEDGVLQTDSRKLRTHYLNSTIFYVDALCLLPLDFLYLSIGYNSLLRCFRLVKIYRFWAFMDRTERHTNYPNVWRMVSLVHYLLACFHWNSCLFHIILVNGGFSSQFVSAQSSTPLTPPQPNSAECQTPTTEDGSSDLTCHHDDVVLAQLKALYWSTQILTTIGSLPPPVSKGDHLFIVCQLLLGMFLFAAVLGHVANIVANVGAARKEFQAKLDAVKTYMRMRHVPGYLQNKVIKWFDYLWLTQKSSDEDRSVSCLPDKLKAEIAIHVHLDTLRRVEIFQNTEAGFLCELVLRLRPVLFSPGDYICRKGEVGRDMYIVNKGRLQVVGDDGKQVLAILKAGSYFGEISILNMGTAGNRRTASVRSVGYSDLFVLSKVDMMDVLKEYPSARLRLEAIASKRLEKNNVPSDQCGGRIRIMGGRSTRGAPVAQSNGMLLGRSNSTPGLLESASGHGRGMGSEERQGRASEHDGWLIQSSRRERKHSVFSMGKISLTSPDCRSKDTRCHTLDSMLSETSSDDRSRPPLPSIIKTSASPMPPQFPSPSIGPGVRLTPSTLEASPASTHHQQFFQSLECPGSEARSVSPAVSSTSGVTAPATASAAAAAGSHWRHAPVDTLMAEIQRLRERLCELESENQSMGSQLCRQRWEMEHRLADIEMHICGSGTSAAAAVAEAADSSAAGDSGSDDAERNQESVI